FRGRIDVGPRPRRAARHRRDRRHTAILPQPFVAAEEERPVPGDRAAEVPAELISLERRNVLIRIVEERARVEPAVAVEFERRSLDGVRPRARDGGDAVAGAAPVLCGVLVDERLELAGAGSTYESSASGSVPCFVLHLQ